MIQMIDRILPRNPSRQTAENRPRAEIVRRWVETADERCPLACVWFALSDISADQDDEPESRWPAFSLSRLKAGCLQSINSLAAPSNLAQSLKNSIQIIAAILLVAISGFANAQEQDVFDDRPGRPAKLPEAPRPADETAPTMFPHSETSRYFIAGQANIIFQADGPFHSPYEGPNSFIGRGEYKVSLLGTLYLGRNYGATRRLKPTPSSILNRRAAAASARRSVSPALPIWTWSAIPTWARCRTWPALSFIRPSASPTSWWKAQRTPFSLATQVPERRLEFYVGKMSLPDYLDINSIGSDSHLQFMNWTVDNNGAWDYAADTRGYTYAAVTEYDDKVWSARYALALMPTVANGIDLDWNLRQASGQNWEFELRKPLLGKLLPPDRTGVVRVLGYVNHAHMGLYRVANQAYLSGEDPTPEITKHETYGAVKYGFTLNAEQELTTNLRAFGRFGWNEGQHESYAYTEVDQTVELGSDYSGRRWSRPFDKLGVAFVSNAIKADHQAYLGFGGLGFLLGDGKLNYGRENILESYYNLHAWRGVYYALDLQFIDHPGYNKDRGPVLVESVRMHVDF